MAMNFKVFEDKQHATLSGDIIRKQFNPNYHSGFHLNKDSFS